MHLTYVALHEVTWCMVVWSTQNAPRWQQFHKAPAMPARKVHHFGGWSKPRYKKKAIHSCRITCEHRESARERRIALDKSDQQQQQYPPSAPLSCVWRWGGGGERWRGVGGARWRGLGLFLFLRVLIYEVLNVVSDQAS